ncbi:MAG: hypothetical protein V7K40_08505 [Nostoc sp.]|uniref:hypothetical protein n=1 Tax=Nostoc sp. TaxID=1180 RepID=UPI002FF6F369
MTDSASCVSPVLFTCKAWSAESWLMIWCRMFSTDCQQLVSVGGRDTDLELLTLLI